MGRSVSHASNSEQVAYASFDGDECDWDYAIENLCGVAQHRYKSLRRCDKWLDREDHALLENNHAYIGVSEYCGLVSIWVVPKGADSYSDPSGLAINWCNQINLQPLAECFGTALRQVGRFSNGEAIFNAIGRPNKGDMGLGYSSKEGWL